MTIDLDELGDESFKKKLDFSRLPKTPVKAGYTADDISRFLKYAQMLRDEQNYSGFRKWFVSGTPYGIENLPKHKAFFDATLDHPEVYFSASNRTGKTCAGSYMTVCHLTGEYPDWWQGRRFDAPVNGMALGDTNVTVRNILQTELLGNQGYGTGMIPAEAILNTTAKSGVSGAVETVKVKHKSGGVSTLGFYSYEQGRKFFQGTKMDFIFMDELPPEEIYAEAYMRTMTTGGSVYITATPLDGLTPLVLNFYTKADFLPLGSELPGIVKLAREDSARAVEENKKKGIFEDAKDATRRKAVIVASWADAPWLSEDDKERIMESIPEHEREARSKGLPSMGAGTVYPLALEQIICQDFEIPAHYKRVCGLDVGWNHTAAIWIAQDPDTGMAYVYSEYKGGKSEPVVHAEAIKRRGDWINVLIDPASRGRSQADGKQIFNLYRKQGLRLIEADNTVESGIYKVWEALSTGHLKVFKSCLELQKEYLTYRRDDRGRIIKENDHALDGLRYAYVGIDLARQKPVKTSKHGGVYGGAKYDL